MEKLLLIDGSSLLHRAFYALPLLSNSQGVFTNAVHGFMMMLNRMLAERQPDLVAVAFDKSRHTFRNDLYPEYKGTRQATPSELKGQFELIKDVLDAARVAWLELEGFEADDILGTLAGRGEADGLEVEIFSGDRDIFQLIDDHTTVFMTRRGISEIDLYDLDAIAEKYGVTPPRLADLKGLMGDSSDNIPGVPGVGEKTAVKLLSEFHDLETLYANLDQIKGKLKEKLAANSDAAYTSRQLATIRRDAPLDLSWEQLRYDPRSDKSALAAIYAQLGLRQLLRGVNGPTRETAPGGGLSAADAEDRPWPSADEGSEGEPVSAATTEAAPLTLPEPGQCGLLLAEGRLALVTAEQQLSLSPEELATQAALLADPAVAKFTIEAKDVIQALANQGLEPAGLSDDAALAAYLLDPTAGQYDLPRLLQERNLPLSTDPVQLAASLPRLCALLRRELADNQMLALYTQIELPLVAVLAKMERQGIRVDGQRLAAMSAELLTRCDDYQRQIFELAGHEFNLNSPKQLGVVLFEEMGVPPLKKTKTGYSTDAEVLETLALTQPIARLLLDFRLAAKLRSTYTEGLGKLIAADGKLHTSFKQTVTATGRLSSVEPNLQNIPVRHELGRRIRRVFTADQEGDLLLAADYNQIELRVLAHMSGDHKLRQAYLDGEDIHRRTAAEVMGVAPEEVTPEMRRAAKAVNFGIVYGISDYGLSRDLGISRKEAQDYILRYFARYPGVAEFQRQAVEAAKQKGYAETLFGRRRYLPDLNSSNYNIRSFAQRVAVNAPIQGSAADIIKLAMIEIDRCLREQGLRSKMLLQVHDELIFNVPREELATMASLVRQQMEQAAELNIPLTVDVKAGGDWYEMHKLEA